MKSRGSHRQTLCILAVAILALLVRCGCGDPSATSWIVELPSEATTVGQFSASVTLGRYTYLFGGLPAASAPYNCTLHEFLEMSRVTAHVVNYVDTVMSVVGVPITLPPSIYPPPWRNISANVSNNASSWIPVTLPSASFGENNVVVIGSAMYSLAMCNTIPHGVAVNASNEEDLDALRVGWKLTLVTDVGSPSNRTMPRNNTNMTFVEDASTDGEGIDHHRMGKTPFPGVPRIEVTSFSLDKTVNPRLNASCVAHGTNIYIVGGVQLSSTGTPSLTTSVAVYDTLHSRFSDSIWNHAEAVGNPGVTSDDAFVYIVGGETASGISQSVFAHHIPSNVRVPESAYPPPAYHFPFVAVSNGVIVVSGSPYEAIATWSIRLKNGFPVANPNSVPGLLHGTLTAVANDQNITLGLFGGVTPNAGINGAFFLSTLTTDTSMWSPGSPTASMSLAPYGVRYFANASTTVSPDWIPNNNGNVTAFVDGYTILWTNFTFSVLFDQTSLESICNISAGGDPVNGAYCTVRIAQAPRCDVPLVGDVIVNPETAWPVKLRNNKTYLAVGPFAAVNDYPTPGGGGSSSSGSSGSSGSATPPPIANQSPRGYDEGWGSADANRVSFTPPLLSVVCFSTSPYQVPDCISASGEKGFQATDCTANFFVPMSQMSPFAVFSSANMNPHPVPSNPPQPPRGASSHMTLFIGVGAGALALLLTVGVIVWCRTGKKELYEEEDDDTTEPGTPAASLLGRRKSSNVRQGSPSPTNAAANQPGLLDGKYRFVQRLGKGSFSVVYLVERVSDMQRFALKYVQIADDTDRHEAMKECEVVHKLQGHPNVIQLYDMFMSYRFDSNLIDGSPPQNSINGSHGSKSQSPKYFDASMNFGVRVDDETQVMRTTAARQASGERFLSLVMEYHERGDLGKWVRKQKGDPRVPEAAILSVAFQVLSVLNYMHHGSPPIIHRDLKPENILLSSVVYENMSSSFLPIVVTDFGLSRVMDKTFCETGVGSLPYVAPECWQRCYSTKVDIWAVGCILYAVCAKRVEPDNVKVMFSESSRPDFHKKLFQDLHNVYQYSEGCAKFIISLLDVDPAHRPTAAEALKRLKRRRAVGLRREVSELEPDKAVNRSYGSEEMSKDAQCEFYIPADTHFEPLSSGWNNNPTYGTNDLALNILASGPLPPRPPPVVPQPTQVSTSSRTVQSSNAANCDASSVSTSSTGKATGSGRDVAAPDGAQGPRPPDLDPATPSDTTASKSGSLTAVSQMSSDAALPPHTNETAAQSPVVPLIDHEHGEDVEAAVIESMKQIAVMHETAVSQQHQQQQSSKPAREA